MWVLLAELFSRRTQNFTLIDQENHNIKQIRDYRIYM